jgi:hypothetical protein
MTVFVSFMFRELEVAERVVSRLETAGVDCVRANFSRIAEDELAQTIEFHLARSTHSIVVTSPGVSPSPWVAFEVGFALASRHPLFVFGTPDESLPPFLAQWPVIPGWADLEDFVEVYNHALTGLDEQDRGTLKNLDMQAALGFQSFKFETWANLSKVKHDKLMKDRRDNIRNIL